MRVSFIGLGNMGAPLARRIAAQYPNTAVFDLSERATSAFVAAAPGSRQATSFADAVAEADVVLTCVPRSENTMSIARELIDSNALKEGAVWVDTTSGEPSASRSIYDLLASAGVQFLDAAVSGGPAGAESVTVTCMIGGDSAAFELAKPVVEQFSGNIVHIGASGAGHAVKAVNNCIMGAQIMLAGEACATLVRHGVDPAKALAAINTSSGRSWATMQRLPDHVLPRTFDYNFALELLRKDVGICKAMINDDGESHPERAELLSAFFPLLDAAAAALDDDADHTEIVKIAERANGVEIKPFN